MRRLMTVTVLGLLLSSCTMASLTSGIKSLNQVATGFASSIQMKQLNPWGEYVPCDGTWYDIHNHQAAIQFYPGPEARVVSLEATFDGNPLGVHGYTIPLPHRRDRQHELRINMVFKPKTGDPVEKVWTMTLDYHED